MQALAQPQEAFEIVQAAVKNVTNRLDDHGDVADECLKAFLTKFNEYNSDEPVLNEATGKQEVRNLLDSLNDEESHKAAVKATYKLAGNLQPYAEGSRYSDAS